LRRFLAGQAPDKDKTLALSKRYGELHARRATNPSGSKGPFLYSTPIRMPKIENTDFLFGAK
jgi:hypothetical protein